MTVQTHLTIDEVAEHFGIEPHNVLRRCQHPTSPWPHHRPNERRSATWYFTEDDIEAIERRIARGMLNVDSWGRERSKAS